jgi:ABC-type transport system involved in cytochrome bd biosynthesis fused ATPase/permease subunit
MCEHCKVGWNSRCACKCNDWMLAQFERNMGDPTGAGRSWLRGANTLGTACNTCHHEVKVHSTPLPRDQRILLAKKRRNASITMVVGIILIFVGVFYLLPILGQGGINGDLGVMSVDMLTIYVLIVGIMAAFMGFSGLVFGYRSQQEQIEGT